MAAFRGSNSGVDVSAASTFRFQRRGHAETFCAASGGRHTLRSHGLGIILALHSDGVSDGGHSVDVMKKWRKGFC